MRQEVRTVLHLLRSSLVSDTRAVSPSLDDSQWLELGHLAKVHGLVPWMLLHLPHATLKTLPESLATDWKAWEQQNRLRVLANWAVTTRVLGVMDSAGIRAMPIKGVALSQQLYGNPWLRHAGDVDVLIDRRMVPAAHAAMIRAGFLPKDLFTNLSASQWRWILNNDHEACYRDRQSGLLVELHWRIHGNGLLNNLDLSWINVGLDSRVRENDSTRKVGFLASLGMTDVGPRRNDGLMGGNALKDLPPPLQREREQIEVLGRKVPALPAPILYLLVMSHLARNRWSRLIWVLDSWKALEAARAIYSDAELQAIIDAHGATRIHQQFLSLMRQVLEGDQLGQWPPPGFGPSLGRTRTLSPLRKGWEGLRFQLGLNGSLRYKLTVLRGYLVATNDFSVVRLPDWLFWLYIPLRLPLYVYRRYLQHSGK